MTANGAGSQALTRQFSLSGPPAIGLFGKHGRAVRNGRVAGYMESTAFAKCLAPSGGL